MSSEMGEHAREILSDLGAVDINRIADEMFVRGYVTPEYADRLVRSGLKSDIRTGLKEPETPGGPPWAKPIEGGNSPKWQQLNLFDFDDFEGVLLRDHKKIEDDIQQLIVEQDDQYFRFGYKTPLPLVDAYRAYKQLNLNFPNPPDQPDPPAPTV